MLRPTLAAALALAATLPLAAEPNHWKFRPGQTYTYECRSEFHFATFQLARRAAAAGAGGDAVAAQPAPDGPRANEARVPTAPSDIDAMLDQIRREEIRWALKSETDPARRSALEALLNKQGLITTEEVRELGIDPQWETVTLAALVTAVGDDGSARVKFTVDAVRIETRFDDTGAHATWDSRKDSPTKFAGFMPYEAMLGHRFEAVIGPDGAIRELSSGDWPAAAAAGAVAKKDRRDAEAANATHAPTPIRTWLEMIFTITPTGGDQWERRVSMPDEEILSLRADSPETTNGYRCVRAKARSRDRERAVVLAQALAAARDGDLAMRMCRETQKQGHSWFSPVAGCMVKSEMKSSSEGSTDRIIVGDFTLEVELKDRGMRELGPPATEGGAHPVETK